MSYILRILSTVLLCLSALVFFVIPTHAATFEKVQPGDVLDPRFGPAGGNVISLTGPTGPKGETGDKGDSANPWGGGEVTGGVKFKEDAEFQKRVGIGTPTNTAATLHINSSSPTLCVGPHCASIPGRIIASGSSAEFTFLDRAATSFVEGPTQGERWVWYAAGGKAHLWSGGNKLSVTSGGSVGIGTTNPGKKLDITGEVAIVNGASAISLSTGGGEGKIWSNRSYDSNNSGAGWTRAISWIDGKVGIGKDNAGYPLDVAGKANATELCIAGECRPSWAAAIGGAPTLQQVTDAGSSTTRALAIPTINGRQTTGQMNITGNTSADDGPFIELRGRDFTDGNRKGELTLGSQGSGSVQFFNTPSAGVWNGLMTMRPDGKIGIGRPDPRSKLDIWNGDLLVTGTDTNGTAYVTSRGGVAYYGNNSYNNGLSVAANGNVGIGTPSPSAKVNIRGGHGGTQLRLTLPAAENGGGTGDVNLQAWVSEPGITWDGGGIGMNVTNDGGANGFGRLNAGLGQSFIRFEPNGGKMRFYTTANNGTFYDTMTLQDKNVTMNQDLTVTRNATANAFFYSSDQTLKKDIRPIPDAIRLIEALQGKRFSWKASGEPSYGFIAQDVEQILPELVETDMATGQKSVEYAKVIPILVEAVKEQQQQIRALQEQVNNK